MQIGINAKNEVVSYLTVGYLNGGIEVDDSLMPADLDETLHDKKYCYIDGKIVVSPYYESNTLIKQKKEEIALLKEELSLTDYKAIKFAEGWITEFEYAIVKEQRQIIRDKINTLEEEIILLQKSI